MGLTIHYTLSLPAKTSVPEIRQKLGRLRQQCLDLPLQQVSEMLEFSGEEQCNPDRLEREHPHRWFLCQADSQVYFQITRNGKPLAVQKLQDGCYMRDVLPTQVIGFSTYPGRGCEQANIGLSRFPKTVSVPNKQTGKNHRLPVAGGGGWHWHSFCKTQYANAHGLENFLGCHLSVIAMLDAAKRIGFKVTVKDEGGYWEKRDIKGLVQEIGSWDAFIAAFAGSLKDANTDPSLKLQAPILEHKDFEHLEAKGQSLLPANVSEVLKKLFAMTQAERKKT